jgi:hypothetical protein
MGHTAGAILKNQSSFGNQFLYEEDPHAMEEIEQEIGVSNLGFGKPTKKVFP